jgi:hypothetical protein
VEELERLLRRHYDFDETVLLRNEEATATNIEEALYRYTDAQVLGPDDSLLIYYSGHGHLDRNERGYWVPVDVEENRIASYIPNSRIRELIADMKCRHVLLVSDACFSGSLFVKGVRSAAGDLAAEEYEKRPSRWAFCSGRHDEQVSDGTPGGHSPFATAILQELALNETRKLNIARLADKVIEITRANYRQMPEANPIQDAGHKGGQYVFTPKAHVPSRPQPGLEPVPVPPAPLPTPKPFWEALITWMITGVILTALLLFAVQYFWPQEQTTTTLVLSKYTIDSDTLVQGATATIRFKIKNTGRIEARLGEWVDNPKDELRHSGNRPKIIPPGGSLDFVYQWKPSATGQRTFIIDINGLNTQPQKLEVRGRVLVRERYLATLNETPKNEQTSQPKTNKPAKNTSGTGKIKPPPGKEPEDDPPPAPQFDTVYTNIPLDVKLWLITDSGKPFDAEIIKGKKAFVLPKGIKGHEHKVYFKQKDKETWDRFPVSTGGIELPDIFKN